MGLRNFLAIFIIQTTLKNLMMFSVQMINFLY
jgi:hypothetical protein